MFFHLKILESKLANSHELHVTTQCESCINLKYPTKDIII
jgi:hypothetical protein